MMGDAAEEVWMRRIGRTICAALILFFLFLEAAAARDEIPGLTATAAIVVEHATGAVIYARRPDLALPPASTTKVLTAYVAVRSGQLDRSLRVSRNATRMQPSKIWLQPNWEMNALDLVYAILLNSANDASVVLAEGLAGSVQRFAREMNEAARTLGAKHSRFVNPNGLPAKGHYSTARDLTLIMRGALRYPLLRQILSTQSLVVRPTSGSRRRIRLRSHNRLLGHGNGAEVIGKTGYTRRAKRCFVGAATSDEREVLFAVLGSRDLWHDVNRLVAYGLERAPSAELQLTESDWEEALPSSANHADDGPDEAHRRYHIRLASFRTRTRADGLRDKVARGGYESVVVEHLLVGSRPLYRVTVRGFTSKEAAREAARSLGRTYKLAPQIVSIGT